MNNTIPRQRPPRGRQAAGSMLIEVLAALGILALVASSVLVVVDRCAVATGDSALRMEAFELARENMEKILTGESVEETVEYGRSEKYPDVTWQTVIEPFVEPVMGKMWVRAVCSAEYKDSADEVQTVKLERWIAELSDQQAQQLGSEPQSIEELAAEQLLDSVELAAEYAGVDVETIDAWVADGLVRTADGGFIKYNLDVYARSDGKPTPQEKDLQVRSIEELAELLNAQRGGTEQSPEGLGGPDGADPLTGVPQEQLDGMDVGDTLRMLKDRTGR